MTSEVVKKEPEGDGGTEEKKPEIEPYTVDREKVTRIPDKKYNDSFFERLVLFC